MKGEGGDFRQRSSPAGTLGMCALDLGSDILGPAMGPFITKPMCVTITPKMLKASQW